MKRLAFVDIARAFAMISIVFMHSIAYSAHCYEVYRFVLSFCVPLFFVLSGYTFHIKDDETFWQFFKSKFLRIMLPYLVWALLFLIPYFAFGVNTESPTSDFGILSTLYGNGTYPALKQNTPLWFLPALFSTEILYYFVAKYLHRPKTKYLILAASILIGFLATIVLSKIFLPWGINSALEIGIFFYLGYLIKDQKFNIPSLIIIAAVGILAYCFNSHANVVWNAYIYQNYFLTIIAGASFSILILELSKLIKQNKVLEYVGQNTMSILIFHKLVVYFCQFKLGAFSAWLANSNFIIEFGLTILVALFAILFSLFVNWLIGKMKLQILLGKKTPTTKKTTRI